MLSRELRSTGDSAMTLCRSSPDLKHCNVRTKSGQCRPWNSQLAHSETRSHFAINLPTLVQSLQTKLFGMSEDQLGVMPMCDDEDSEGSWESDADDEVDAGEKTQCLFSGDVFPTSAAALEHDRTHFGFDLAKYISQVCEPSSNLPCEALCLIMAQQGWCLRSGGHG